jgi:hypothetical protein
MTTAIQEIETPTRAATPRERVVDAARHTAHLSHEARLLKSVAADAVEDGVYRARRVMKTARRDIADRADEAAYRIKRAPLRSVALAFGAGIGFALASGAAAWLAMRAARGCEARSRS